MNSSSTLVATKALARELLIALQRYVHLGEVPEGVGTEVGILFGAMIARP
jgi:hypothetical protein